MIVDFHTHAFPPGFRARRTELAARDATFGDLFADPKARMATSNELVSAMDEDGVDVSRSSWASAGPIRASRARPTTTSSSRWPAILAVSLDSRALTPAWPDWGADEAERCAAAGLRGVGELHPDTQRFDIGDASTMAPLVDVAGQHGLVLTTHSSEPVGHSYPGKGRTRPEALWRFIQAYPDVVLVCAHWGGGLPFYALMPEVGAALGNVYFDTAASPFLYEERIFDVATRLVGAEKVLLASDHPLIRPKRVLGELDRSGLSPADRAAVAGGNAARLLGLEPCPPSPGGSEIEGGGDARTRRPES